MMEFEVTVQIDDLMSTLAPCTRMRAGGWSRRASDTTGTTWRILGRSRLPQTCP